MFYKHAGKTLKCIVSSATQVLGTGESGEKEDVVTENCADLLVRLLPIVMMVKYGTKGSVVRCVRSLSARIWITLSCIMRISISLIYLTRRSTLEYQHSNTGTTRCQGDEQHFSVLDKRSDSAKSECWRSVSSQSLRCSSRAFGVS